jgi:hypothetical protein
MTSISMAGLVKPANGSTLNYIHVLFEWEQESGASSYNLQVSQGNNPPIIDIEASSLYFIVGENIDWGNSYSWKVRPNNSENWIGPNTFSTGSTISDVDVTIHNGNLYSPGFTIFSSFFNYYSAVFDQEGNEVWNTGQSNIVYYNTDYDGKLFGCWLDNDSPNNLPGIEFNLDGDFTWEEPNEEFLHHDLIQLPNGNYLGIVETSQFGPIPLGSWTEICQDYGYVADGIFLELFWIGDKIVEWDKVTKEVVWSWNVFDYFNMEDYDSGLWDNVCADNGEYDWTHINAIVFDEEESAIYISTRHLSRITKIDYSSKDVVWNMGRDMPSDDVGFGHNLGFSWQHSLQVLNNGNVLTLDNGNRSESFLNTEFPTTRGIEISIEENNGEYSAVIVWEYSLSEELFGFASGNVQKLENGNYLITTVGGGGTVLEITPENEIVWQANLNLSLPSGAVYRANRISSLYPNVSQLGVDGHIPLITDFHLNAPYPNPFNPTVNIDFSIIEKSVIHLLVYDIKGTELETIFKGVQNPGFYKYRWTVGKYPSGTYFISLKTEKKKETKKIVLLK